MKHPKEKYLETYLVMLDYNNIIKQNISTKEYFRDKFNFQWPERKNKSQPSPSPITSC